MSTDYDQLIDEELEAEESSIPQKPAPKAKSTESDVTPISPRDEHPLLKQMMAARLADNNSIIATVKGNFKIRLQLLKARQMFRANQAAGDSDTREEVVSIARMYEIIIRAITHINETSIEEIAGIKVIGKRATDKANAREQAIERLRPYYEEILDEDDIAILSQKYLDLYEQNQDATDELNDTPKKKSDKPSSPTSLKRGRPTSASSPVTTPQT